MREWVTTTLGCKIQGGLNISRHRIESVVLQTNEFNVHFDIII